MRLRTYAIGGTVLIAMTCLAVLLPAVLAILGERTWYLPRWLSWLPHLEVEGRRD